MKESWMKIVWSNLDEFYEWKSSGAIRSVLQIPTCLIQISARFPVEKNRKQHKKHVLWYNHERNNFLMKTTWRETSSDVITWWSENNRYALTNGQFQHVQKREKKKENPYFWHSFWYALSWQCRKNNEMKASQKNLGVSQQGGASIDCCCLSWRMR
jgi:hypothetical protein